MTDFAPVAAALDEARLVAWDGCHKLYVAMDNSSADWFRDWPNNGYAHIVQSTPTVMLAAIKQWWAESCELRFVQAVRWNADEFETLIEQFEDDDTFAAFH